LKERMKFGIDLIKIYMLTYFSSSFR